MTVHILLAESHRRPSRGVMPGDGPRRSWRLGKVGVRQRSTTDRPDDEQRDDQTGQAEAPACDGKFNELRRGKSVRGEVYAPRRNGQDEPAISAGRLFHGAICAQRSAPSCDGAQRLTNNLALARKSLAESRSRRDELGIRKKIPCHKRRKNQKMEATSVLKSTCIGESAIEIVWFVKRCGKPPRSARDRDFVFSRRCKSLNRHRQECLCHKCRDG